MNARKSIILQAVCIAVSLAATDKYIRTAKPKTLNERRRAACLPSAR